MLAGPPGLLEAPRWPGPACELHTTACLHGLEEAVDGTMMMAADLVGPPGGRCQTLELTRSNKDCMLFNCVFVERWS